MFFDKAKKRTFLSDLIPLLLSFFEYICVTFSLMCSYFWKWFSYLLQIIKSSFLALLSLPYFSVHKSHCAFCLHRHSLHNSLFVTATTTLSRTLSFQWENHFTCLFTFCLSSHTHHWLLLLLLMETGKNRRKKKFVKLYHFFAKHLSDIRDIFWLFGRTHTINIQFM